MEMRGILVTGMSAGLAGEEIIEDLTKGSPVPTVKEGASGVKWKEEMAA